MALETNENAEQALTYTKQTLHDMFQQTVFCNQQSRQIANDLPIFSDICDLKHRVI